MLVLYIFVSPSPESATDMHLKFRFDAWDACVFQGAGPDRKLRQISEFDMECRLQWTGTEFLRYRTLRGVSCFVLIYA